MIVVLAADPPITASERELLVELAGRAVKTFIVLNKVDRLDDAELSEALEFTRSVCEQAGIREPIWTLSARVSDRGYLRFARSFGEYVEAQAEADAERAIVRHVTAFADAVRDELAVGLRTLELSAQSDSERVTAFLARLRELEREGDELDDRTRTAESRLRRQLNESAAELDRRARSRLAELVEEPVGRWRSEQAASWRPSCATCWSPSMPAETSNWASFEPLLRNCSV